MKRRRPFVAGLLSLSLAVSNLTTYFANAQTPVRVAKVRSETLQQRQAVTGSLRAVARGDVAALEAGRLVELRVRAGDSVSKGDVIAKIDDRRLQAERAAAEADQRIAEAELKRHQATAKLAARNLARAESLVGQNAVSEQEVDRYRAESAVSIAEIEAAQRRIQRAAQTIRLLDVRLADVNIFAPYDASVVERHVEPGDWVRPGDKLLTLVSRGPLEAWLEVPERLAASVLDDAGSVVVRSAALDRHLRVVSTKRLEDVNPRVRTIHLIATVENSDGILAPGMSIDGFVPSGREGNYLTVPKDAVVRRSGQPTVFVVDEQETAQQLPIRVLFETPDRVAVAAMDLASGSRVIVEGNERLMPSQVVKVVVPANPIDMKIAQR